MAYSEKKRFVAGAVCPRCSEIDKIMVYREQGKDYRECVSCGFKDEMHFPEKPRELTTRVTPEEKSEAVSVIKILPSGNS